MSECDRVFNDFLNGLDTSVAGPLTLTVAFSGGVDSTVLLHLAARYAPKRVRAIHINHGYDPAAGHWQTHCQQICAQLRVPLEVAELGPAGRRLSETQARQRRYQAFARLLSDTEVLLLAHHMDDAAESLLLHQLQGRGSYAMPAHRHFAAARLARPLLPLRRAELVEYARQQALSWLDDPSNADLRHDRNYLRHEIVPRLESRFAPVAQRLAQAGKQLQVMERLLIEQFDLRRPQLPIAVLRAHDLEAQQALVRLWLLSNDYGQPSARSLREFLSQIAGSDADRQPLLQYGERTLRRYRDQLWSLSELQPDLVSRQLPNAGKLVLPQGVLMIEQGIGELQPSGSLTVNFWQGGDPDCPRTLLLRGRHQRIKELLRSRGIPPWRRQGYPILCDQQGVLCIPGVASRDQAHGGDAGIAVSWAPHD